MVEKQNGEITKECPLIVITGPTACGKTGRAVSLAKFWDAEIISADSRQVYRKMDLGTGKDLDEYEDVSYHLIDICEPGEKYNLHRYIKDFRIALNDINRRKKNCIVCGGSGMYLENALADIDLPDVPENVTLRKSLESKSLAELAEILKTYKSLHNSTDIDTAKRAIRAIEIGEFYRLHPEQAIKADRKRVAPLLSIIIGIDIPREERIKRIDQRLDQRLESGMVNEVVDLLNSGLDPEDLIYYGLEYKYLTLYVIGKISHDEMRNQLATAIHQFAKRQMTWFRGMERRGFKIHWIPFDLPSDDFNKKVLALYEQS